MIVLLGHIKQIVFENFHPNRETNKIAHVHTVRANLLSGLCNLTFLVSLIQG